MKRWTTHLTVAVAYGCAGLVSAAERPNILLIVSEDKTPVLDKLASIGFVQLVQRLPCVVQPSSDDQLCDVIESVCPDFCSTCH